MYQGAIEKMFISYFDSFLNIKHIYSKDVKLQILHNLFSNYIIKIIN